MLNIVVEMVLTFEASSMDFVDVWVLVVLVMWGLVSVLGLLT